MKPSSDSYYKVRYKEESQRDWIWQQISQFFLSHDSLAPSAAVLEMGAGYGSWIRSIPSPNKQALDLNPAIAEIFKTRGILDVKTRQGSCVDLKFVSDASLDLVLASNLLEHLEWPEIDQCLSEVLRVLKPGGSLWIVQPNFSYCYRNYFDDYTHRTIFTHHSLADLLASKGFQLAKMWPKFLPYSMKSKLSLFAFLIPIYLRSPFKPMAGQMALIAKKEK